MSIAFEVNTKLEAYKLVHDPTRLLCLLFSKYGDIDEDFYLLKANQLVYNKSTHYNICFREFVFNSNNKEYFRRFYKKNESTKRIPKLYEYYKNYHSFFCRPIFRNFPIAKLMSNYEDTKAEIFYKNNYTDEEDDKKNKEEKKIKNDSSSLSSLDNITDNKIIFDEKNKLIIEKDLDSKNLTLTLTNEKSIIQGTGLLNSKRSNENNEPDSFIKIVDYFVNYKKKNEISAIQNKNIKNNDNKNTKENNNNVMNNKSKINCKVNTIKNNLYFLSKKKYINAQKINSNNNFNYNINNNVVNNNETNQKKGNNIFISPQTTNHFYTNISSRINEFNKNKPLNVHNGKNKNKSYNITNNKNNSNNKINQNNLISNINTNNSLNNNNTLYNNFNNYKNLKNISASIKPNNSNNHGNNFNNSITKNVTRNLTNIYNNRSNNTHQDLKSNGHQHNQLNQFLLNNNSNHNNISDNNSNKNLKLPRHSSNAILNNLKKMTQSPSGHSPFGFSYKILGSKFSLVKGSLNSNKNINNKISKVNNKNNNKNEYKSFYSINNKNNNFLMYNQIIGDISKIKKKNSTQKNLIVSNFSETNIDQLNSIYSPKMENNISYNNYKNYIDGVNKSKNPFIKAKNHISYSNNNFNINFNNIIFYGGQNTPNNNIYCIKSNNKHNKNLNIINCSPIGNISRNKKKISIKGFCSQSKGSKKNESEEANNKKISTQNEKKLIEKNKNKNYTSNKIKKNTCRIKIDNIEFHINKGKNVSENNNNNIKNCKPLLMDHYVNQNKKKMNSSSNYIREVYSKSGNLNDSLKKIDKK